MSPADRAGQRVVHDAVLPARLLVEQVAESRDPVFAVMGGRAKHRIGDSGLVEAAELLVALIFSTRKSNRWIVGIPARPSMATAVEPARPPPMVAMLVYFMGDPGRVAPVLRPEKQIKAWSGKTGTKMAVFGIIYPGKIDRPGRPAGRARHRDLGLPEFARSAESADAIGISGVLVSLDLTTHRL